MLNEDKRLEVQKLQGKGKRSFPVGTRFLECIDQQGTVFLPTVVFDENAFCLIFSGKGQIQEFPELRIVKLNTESRGGVFILCPLLVGDIIVDTVARVYAYAVIVSSPVEVLRGKETKEWVVPVLPFSIEEPHNAQFKIDILRNVSDIVQQVQVNAAIENRPRLLSLYKEIYSYY